MFGMKSGILGSGRSRKLLSRNSKIMAGFKTGTNKESRPIQELSALFVPAFLNCYSVKGMCVKRRLCSACVTQLFDLIVSRFDTCILIFYQTVQI